MTQSKGDRDAVKIQEILVAQRKLGGFPPRYQALGKVVSGWTARPTHRDGMVCAVQCITSNSNETLLGELKRI